MKKGFILFFVCMCWGAGLKAQNDSLAITGTGINVVYTPAADTVYTCYQANIKPVVADASLYFWSWSPATYLNTSSSDEAICTPSTSITYTVTGIPFDTVTPPYTAQVTVIPQPAFSTSTFMYDDVCTYGNSYAWVTITGADSADVFTYNWSNGDTDPVTGPLAPAKYTVTVLNQWGCPVIDTIQVADEETIIDITGVVVPASCGGCANGSIDASVVSLPAAPLDFLWSNGPTTEDIDSLLPGTYTLTVTTADGCTQTQIFEVGNLSGLDEQETIGSFSVYPVPVTNQLTVTASEKIDRIEVYTSNGKLLENHRVNSSNSVLPVFHWPRGLYCIRIVSGHQTACRNIVKE